MFTVNIVDRCCFPFIFRNTDFQILAHEVVAIIHNDVFRYGILDIMIGIRRKSERHFFPCFFDVVDCGSCIRDLRLPGQGQIARGKPAVAVLLDFDLLLVQVKFSASAKLQAVFRRQRHEFQLCRRTFFLQIYVDRIYSVILKFTFCNLHP